MSRAKKTFFTVSIETWGDGFESYDEDVLWELGPMLADLGAVGPVASAGGLSGGPAATFTLLRPSDLELGGLAGSAVELFETACDKLGLDHRGIARVELLDEKLLDLELSQEPESHVGVAEIAKLLGVSRQRVAELRKRTDFPAPIAELAAGPVWTRTSLNHFVEGWPRKPGRPRSAAPTS